MGSGGKGVVEAEVEGRGRGGEATMSMQRGWGKGMEGERESGSGGGAPPESGIPGCCWVAGAELRGYIKMAALDWDRRLLS